MPGDPGPDTALPQAAPRFALEDLARPTVLIRPLLLLLLTEAPGHGYDLVERLRALGFDWSDHGPVYGHLRRLRQADLIRSVLATEQAGPARRVYELTSSGDEMLTAAAQRMEELDELVGAFRRRYEALPSTGNGPSVRITSALQAES